MFELSREKVNYRWIFLENKGVVPSCSQVHLIRLETLKI